MKAKILKQDGRAIEVEPLNGETFCLKEMYELLGCELIEIVTLRNSDDILVIDEEGKFNSGKFINDRATEIAARHGGIATYDYIVGDALLCRSEMVD